MERFKFPLISAGIVVVVLLVAYMAWISPEGSKLSKLNTQEATLTSQEQGLSADIAHLRVEGGHLVANCTHLSERVAQIPVAPDEGAFLTQIDALATSTGTSLPGYTFSLPSATSGAPTTSASTTMPSITVTLNFSGTYSQVTAFLNGLDKLGRLYAVQSYSLKQPNQSSVSSSGTPIILPASAISYEVTLVGNIYYNPTQKDVCAKSSLP